MAAHIHGRFQPFHKDHADYARWASENTDRLIIGITNADPSHITEEDSETKRHKPKHNPFTYFERHTMIQSFLSESSISSETVIAPFPINRPELWDYYAPESVTHYNNILEEWHEVKVNRFKKHGRSVVTKRGTRNMSGESIRERMAAGQNWEQDVPDAVVEIIREIEGERRVKDLYQ